jgi:hypothetical protein
MFTQDSIKEMIIDSNQQKISTDQATALALRAIAMCLANMQE